jgi:hypothetical protein
VKQINNILPVALAQGMETKLIGDLSSIHCIWQILLVSKNEQDSIPQLILPVTCG